MQRELKITARDFLLTPAIESVVRAKAGWLANYYPRLTGCEVVLEGAVEHHRRGGPFKVRIIMTVPGSRLIVNRRSAEDFPVAIRDAFDAARRRLEDYGRRRRGTVKLHEAPPQGRIASLFGDYGFIRSGDGRDIYFHRNSVAEPGFDRLQTGSEVRFVEEDGEQGPQASTVHVAHARSAASAR